MKTAFLTFLSLIFASVAFAASTNDLHGKYSYTTVDGDGNAIEATIAIADGTAIFKAGSKPAQKIKMSLEMGVQPDLAAILTAGGKSLPATLIAFKTSLDLQNTGKLVPVTIIEDTASSPVTITFYQVTNGQPVPIINRAEKVD